MGWKPVSEVDSVIARDMKEIAAALIAARRALNPDDPQQGLAWTMVDRAEARLQGLVSILRD
jgi:hypothetical protein